MQGPYSRNPLAYKYYNAEEEILGKKMKVSAVNSNSMFL
jgi:xylose isomerase